MGLDGEGRVTQVTASAGQNPVTSVTYNTASQATQVNLGSGDSDVFAYDSNTLRMTQFKFNVGAQPQSYVGALTWNANSTLNQLAITDPFNSADTQTCNYAHDDLTRIASANCGSAAAQTFSYDPFGNLSKSGSPYSFLPTYSTSTNHMTSLGSFTPTYDNNGNLLNDNVHSYAWDAYGHSTTIDVATLTFDALDRLAEVKGGNGTTYQNVYAPSGARLGYMQGQSLLVVFIPLPGGATADYSSNASGTVDRYDHNDWLGSTRLTSTASRAFSAGSAYAPFGEPYAVSSNLADLSFTGQFNGTANGIYDFPFREYSIEGRWPAPDPAGLAAANPANPQSWNRYAYVRNNPLNRIDPLGLNDCPDLKAECGDIFGDPGGAAGVDVLGGFGPGNPGNGCSASDASCGGTSTEKEIARDIAAENAFGFTALNALQAAGADFIQSINEQNMILSKPPGGPADRIVYCSGPGTGFWECSPNAFLASLLMPGWQPFVTDVDEARLRHIARSVVSIAEPGINWSMAVTAPNYAAMAGIFVWDSLPAWFTDAFNGINNNPLLRIGPGYDQEGNLIWRIASGGRWGKGGPLLPWHIHFP